MTPVDYIEAPLIYAQALLCQLTATAGDCQRAEQLKAAALRRFGYLLDFSPRSDTSSCSGCSRCTRSTATARCTSSPLRTRAPRRRAPPTAKGCTCSPGMARRCPPLTPNRACCRRRPPPPACSRGWLCTRRRRVSGNAVYLKSRADFRSR